MSIRILAIETTVDEGSVAAFAGTEPMAEIPLDRDVRSAQSLAPTLKSLLESISWEPQSISLVAVDIGPGSFTGTRIGVTTAKAFAYAVGAECLAVRSLEVVAEQMPSTPTDLSVAINAQRQQVFTATFSCEQPRKPLTDEEIQILDNDVWLQSLAPQTTVSGLALEKLAPKLPSNVHTAPQETWIPRASTIAQLAAERYTAGHRDDLWKLKPLYLRRSAAEEVWLKRKGLL